MSGRPQGGHQPRTILVPWYAYESKWGNVGDEVRTDPVALWVHSLRPWQDFATMTFRPRAGRGTSQYAATQHWRDFMDREGRGASYFAAFEPNPGFPGYHVHALLYGLPVLRSVAWQAWHDQHGRNRIEPIRSKGDVLSYCAKYVVKDPNTWWDVRVLPLLPAEASP